MKCTYYGCKGKATKEIKTKINDDSGDSYDYTLQVCEECYNEYLEIMGET